MSSSNTSQSQQQQQPTQEKNNDIENEDEIIVIDDNIKQAAKKALEELNIDTKNNSDLLNKDLPDIQLSEEHVQKIINDTSVKKLYKEPYEQPLIEDTLDSNEQLVKLTKEEIQTKREDMNLERQSMIMILSAKQYIKLHLKTGMVEGKALWVEKKYYFNPITKREDLALRLKVGRAEDIRLSYQQTLGKPADKLTDRDYKFLKDCQYLIDVANYEMQATEAKLRLGMSEDDFARISHEEYTFALQVINYRTIAPPFSRQRQ